MKKKHNVGHDGFVQYIDHMGSDKSVVDAARVSYGNHTLDDDVFDVKDKRLLRYLMRHWHETPFEMCTLKVAIRCPIHVGRQLCRHRTLSFNEYSTRYKEAIDSFEEAKVFRKQSGNNKQGSDGVVDTQHCDDLRETLAGEWIHPVLGVSSKKEGFLEGYQRRVHEFIRAWYRLQLDMGVAREQARGDLPMSTYTEMYISGNLRNFLGMLLLRMDSHAQVEIREFAYAIAKIVEELWPATWHAFCNYRLFSESFSEKEMVIINQALCSVDIPMMADSFEWDSEREKREFLDKLGFPV